jgi:hypothetical protein
VTATTRSRSTHPRGLMEYAGSRQIPPELHQYRGWEGHHTENSYSHWIWRQYASAFWDDIRIARPSRRSTGFIGRSGSGKSYAAMRLAELFLQHGAQIIALDWVGIWWSLRLAANGKDAGFEHVYIFGGEHADVELRPESGALMADLVVDKHISVVLDVMHFRKAERTRFATAFAEQFFHRKKTARTACHLFIEEAQAYLPQMVRGEEARMVGVFEDIGKVGRNYGIGNSLISQRPQAINKDVLNQVEVLLAFQTNGPQERKAIAGWTAENTDAGAAMMQELPKLMSGTRSSGRRSGCASRRRCTSRSATRTTRAPHRRSRRSDQTEDAGEGGPRAARRAEMKATIEKAKADDPRELRKQIADLTRSTPARLVSDGSMTPALRGPLLVLANNQEDGCGIGKLALLSGKRISGGFRNILAALRTNGWMEGSNTGVMRITPAGLEALGSYDPLPSGAELGEYWLSNGMLTPAAREILRALLAHRAGYAIDALAERVDKQVSGGFRNLLAELRTAGVIVGRNTEVMRASEELFS